ncbi:hypothetical protein BFL28_16335 [Sphingomonas turrisvirgatae]|uniref:HTH arsR-type domain-containing protein n=2 Tax=Sphingomonas turrisvirgatae TaxID=1888892 RepID=A0A1E3LYT8_9SPHN|nr:hypothetical protein BFL28_16335 [Sphingomonas turrisvirgatae]
MDDMNAIAAMSALAQPTRLAMFRLLAEAGDAGLSSGEIARRLGVPINNLTSHLAILSRAGLVESVKTGRVVTSRARRQAIDELVRFLNDDCRHF